MTTSAKRSGLFGTLRKAKLPVTAAVAATLIAASRITVRTSAPKLRRRHSTTPTPTTKPTTTSRTPKISFWAPDILRRRRRGRGRRRHEEGGEEEEEFLLL